MIRFAKLSQYRDEDSTFQLRTI